MNTFGEKQHVESLYKIKGILNNETVEIHSYPDKKGRN